MARPMANDPPFATLNHFTGDLGIPSESDSLRIGIKRQETPSGLWPGRVYIRQRRTVSLGEETVPSDANARADIYATRCSSTLRIRLFHIADDGLPTIVHMDVARLA